MLKQTISLAAIVLACHAANAGLATQAFSGQIETITTNENGVIQNIQVGTPITGEFGLSDDPSADLGLGDYLVNLGFGVSDFGFSYQDATAYILMVNGLPQPPDAIPGGFDQDLFSLAYQAPVDLGDDTFVLTDFGLYFLTEINDAIDDPTLPILIDLEGSGRGRAT